MHIAHFGLFVAACLALLLTPGPAVLYIVTRSLEQGRRAGLLSTLGLHTGTLVHLGAALAGLSALLVSSAVAFATLRWIGAAYLVWLGLRTLRSGADRLPDTGAAVGHAGADGGEVGLPFLPLSPEPADGAAEVTLARAAPAGRRRATPLPARALRQVYVQGIVVNIFNPKSALFFLAFLPQFVDLTRPDARLQMLTLGGTFMALGLVTDGLYVLLAGAIASRLRHSRRLARGGRFLAGGVYIGLGVVTAVAGARH
jgi:threonine/homoserine/homoserine lactone efflux protein